MFPSHSLAICLRHKAKMANVWTTPTNVVPELRWPFVRLYLTQDLDFYAWVDEIEYKQVK